MLRVLSVLLLAFLFSLPASSQSNPPPSSTVNLRLEQLQQQINQLQTEVKAAQNNPADHDNLVTLTQHLTDLEKRVEDVHQSVNYWGWFSGSAFAVITLLFVYVSFRTLKLAENEAKKAFKRIRKKAVDDIKNAGKLVLDEIKEQAAQQRDEHANKYSAFLDQLSSKLSDKTLDPNELQRGAELLRQKPEDQYGFDDWRTLYMEAINRNTLGEADKYVEGMEHSATDDLQNATAKMGRARLLDERKKHTEAIKLWDEVFDEYGASDDPRLIDRVVVAQIRKCFALEKQGQWEAIVDVCGDLVSRFGARTEAIIVYKLAGVLTLKGYMLNEHGQPELAIAVYGEVVSRYEARNEAEIVEQVARALINRADALRELNRIFEAKAAYETIIERYGSLTESEILEIVCRAKKAINELGNI
ncbi:MAG: tetratricopeptide repeat protein [Methylobacter sp.]|nr:tetratricopeptide repeat protein [Methylobacter sp.]